MKKYINKLVRDNIPAICIENGQIPVSKIIDDKQYTIALQSKLQEEVKEYLTSNEVEELADILEVIEALAENQGTTFEEIMRIKCEKQIKNGAFKNKVFLINVDD